VKKDHSDEPSEVTTPPRISPFARLLLVAGITLGVILLIVLSIVFRQDPFANDLQNSENMEITDFPSALPTPLSIE